MLAKLRPRLTFSNVVACMALFVALGGSSYAAVKIKKNSVGSRQIKNGGVKNKDLAKNSVTTTKVKNQTLKALDFKKGQLPSGPRGVAGATRVVTRASSPSPMGTGGASTGESARCETNEKLVGGGVLAVNPSTGLATREPGDTITASGPDVGPRAPNNGETSDTWQVGFDYTTGGNRNLITYALCAKP